MENNTLLQGTIEHKGVRYSYIRALAKNGDLCLATKDPLQYCNGVFTHSSKDPGDGVEFVVINQETSK